MPTTSVTGETHQVGTIPATRHQKLRAAVPSYPSLWRTWNSRCVVSLTGHGDERQVPGPTKELIRGSPIPIRARDDDVLPVMDGPPPPAGTVRKFTMDQFQREFGPCHTYSAPASPLRKRPSIESTETIPLNGLHPRRLQPTFAAAAAATVPATLGRGGWRPVTGRFSLDSSLPASRWDETSTLPSARKPLSALDNVPAEKTRVVKLSKSFDDAG